MSAALKRNEGFTLIELMIVILIIGILSTIGLVVYFQGQKQARIKKRLGDIRSFQTAIEIYKQQIGSYPTTMSGGIRQLNTFCSSLQITPTPSNINTLPSFGQSQIVPGLIPNYLPAFPADPSVNISAGTSCYVYQSNGIDYKFSDLAIPSSEMSAADFNTRPELIDPQYNGLNTAPCNDNQGSARAWAIYSTSSDTTVPCW